MPPIALLFPVGVQPLNDHKGRAYPAWNEYAEPLPGRTVPVWEALGWFTGEVPLPTLSDPAGGTWHVERADFDEWQEDRAGLVDYNWHDKYIEQWREHRKHAMTFQDAKQREALLRQATEHYEVPLWDTRRRLRELGMRLPELPDELTHIDSDDFKPDFRRFLGS
ncbi:hypothetical protein SAMN05421773_12116 [Streptomyces aidingensis]|uniref:Uncharacterized protein n=1 Tax=Streptomyces aidingensis TaxID=910347 RepID=A0A1I1TT33_9ACTN|nr:hypothetical protein SAMN05421773_12116 [Streptomyces aidingensis]